MSYDELTWNSLIKQGIAALEKANVPQAVIDGRMLAAYSAQKDLKDFSVFLATDSHSRVPEQVRTKYQHLISQRVQRVPLQHLIGSASFRYLELEVGPGVFVPRPETELLVQYGLERAQDIISQGYTPRIVDLGTGSGAIALSLAYELKTADIYAVELSSEALEWTHKNLRHVANLKELTTCFLDRSNLSENQINKMLLSNKSQSFPPVSVTLIEGDLETVLEDHQGCFDIVISNPPYIPDDCIPNDPEVRIYDPDLALYGGGQDGMKVPAAALRTAGRLLKSGGIFMMEHANTQGEAVFNLLNTFESAHHHNQLSISKYWTNIELRQDLAGKDRHTLAIKT